MPWNVTSRNRRLAQEMVRMEHMIAAAYERNHVQKALRLTDKRERLADKRWGVIREALRHADV